jgi:Bacteriophage protein of unknown function (DUF646).
MTDFDLGLDGLEAAIDELEELERDISTSETHTVGTAINYSVFLEFGTSKMDAKPFFRPVINEVRLQRVDGFIAQNTRTSVADLDDIDQILKALALAMERRIKEVITQKGLIDTGTLRASIVAVPGGTAALPDESDFGSFDSDTVAPQGEGRALAEETISL